MSQIKSIKCTNCAAPLELFGGGRVESITCKYCKSVLDLNDNYKVLTNFKNVKEQHKLPFEVGMRGELKGIDYTIIGRITYSDVEYPHGEWTDFLLFSPLYGYAYLTYENGHLIYSKRERKFPNIAWSSIAQKPAIKIAQRLYVPFDSYEAKVVFVEGELTWIAKRNDKTSFIELIQPPFGISAEKSKNEIEYYRAEYLDRDTTYEAFKATKEEPPKSFHILKPFEKPFLKSLSYIASLVLFIATLLALMVAFDGEGEVIKEFSTTNKEVKEVDFNVTSDKYLVNIELSTVSSATLKNYNFQIYHKKHLISSFNYLTSYLFKKESKKVIKHLGLWDKKAKKVRVLLNLPKGNNYRLVVKPINSNLSSTIYVKIEEEYSKLNYFKWFIGLTFLLWILYKLYYILYKKDLEEKRGVYHEIDYIQVSVEDNNKNWLNRIMKNSSFITTFYLIVFAIFIILYYRN